MDIYQKMLQRDPRLLSEISGNIDMIEPELLPKVAQWLLSLDDYKIKWNLADSISTPKSLLRALVGDPDETIAELARSQFSADGATVFDVDDEGDPFGERDD
jgi:hypothetical protein